MGHVTELVDALRSLCLDDPEPPLSAVAALLTQRAPILEAIVALDPRALGPSDREELQRALEEARRHDARLTEALVAAQARTTAALGRLVEARSAARGYRGGPHSKAGSVLRTA